MEIKLFVIIVFACVDQIICEHGDYSNSSFTKTPEIVTKSGQVFGTIETFRGQQVWRFLGIPFAKPPIHKLRFAKPVRLAKWSGLLNATLPAPKCMQNLPKSDPDSMSEDCLYLNIITTQLAYERRNFEKRPVLVYLHGGAFTKWSAIDPTYLSSPLVVFGDLVLVTVAYRLNIFGFAWHEDKTKGFIGNLGLWDQNMALQWIQNNIAAFGGDPNKVTLAGHSAGSKSTFYHLFSSHANGLFRNAILSSGVGLYFTDNSNERVNESLTEVINKFGCHQPDTRNCLQNKTAIELLKAVPNRRYAFSPIYDDDYLPKSPADLLKAGELRAKPINLLIAFTKDDGSIFLRDLYPDIFNQSKADLTIGQGRTYLEKLFRKQTVNLIAKTYFNCFGRKDKIRYGLIRMYTDMSIACPSLKFAELYSTLGGGEVHVANQTSKPIKSFNEICQQNPLLGVCHSDEIPFVFGAPFVDKKKYSKSDAMMSYQMIMIYSHFVHTGKGLKQGPQPWTYWRKDGQDKLSSPVMQLDADKIGIVDENYAKYCLDNWEFFRENLIKPPI